MIRIGLTGSIAMGKSTTAQLFRDRGVPVHDADAVVHRLYAKGGAAVPAVAGLAPEAIVDGAVDRGALKARIAEDPSFLARLEAVVHPLVLAERAAFEAEAARSGADVVVLDVPLLFETGADAGLDYVVVVTTSAEKQRRRALSRPGMTEADFERILAKQIPDAEKRRRADYIVDTSVSVEDAARQIDVILEDIRGRGEAAS